VRNAGDASRCRTSGSPRRRPENRFGLLRHPRDQLGRRRQVVDQSHGFADRRVTATVTDDAPAYDPLARAEVDITLPLEERPIGGLGVHLEKKLMDSARYERRDGRNILTFVRTIGAAI